jgi:hypothetical protein
VSTRIAAWLLVALLAVAAGGVFWRFHRATEESRAEQAARRAQHTELAEKLARAETAAIAAERARAEFAASSIAGRSASAVPAAPPAAAPRPPHSVDILASDPKLQLMARAAQRAQFETAYGPFFRSLQLSPAQIAQLGEAWTKSDEQQQDLRAIVRERKLRPDDPSVAQLLQEAADELRTAQIAVLGEGGYDRLQDYERTLPARAIIERFAGALALADRPLTAAQAESLTQAVAASASSSGRRIDPTTIDWAFVDQQAQGVLSSEQFALFRRIEPVGGGSSRWMIQFERAINDARKVILADPKRRN